MCRFFVNFIYSINNKVRYYCCCCCSCVYFYQYFPNFLEVPAAKQPAICSIFFLTKPDIASTVKSDDSPQCSRYHWRQFVLKYRCRFITTIPWYFQAFKDNGKVSEEHSDACKIKIWSSEADPPLVPVLDLGGTGSCKGMLDHALLQRGSCCTGLVVHKESSDRQTSKLPVYP